MIKRFLQQIHLTRGDTALRVVIGATVIDDIEGTSSETSALLKSTPLLATEYTAIVNAAIALRDAVLAYAAAAGKPLTTEALP